jgi:hypothetical protein
MYMDVPDQNKALTLVNQKCYDSNQSCPLHLRFELYIPYIKHPHWNNSYIINKSYQLQPTHNLHTNLLDISYFRP